MDVAAAVAAGGGPDPLRPQRPAGLGRGAMLALLVHGGLLVALALGVSWRASEPTGATAELWAAVPEFAAPAPVVQPATPPAPPPPQVAKPKPEPEPTRLRCARPRLPSRRPSWSVNASARPRPKPRGSASWPNRKRERKKLAEQEAQRKKLAEKAEKAEQERIEKLRQDNLKRMPGRPAPPAHPRPPARRRAMPAPRPAMPGASSPASSRTSCSPRACRRHCAPRSRCAPRPTAPSSAAAWSSPAATRTGTTPCLRALDRTEILPRDIDGRVPSPIDDRLHAVISACPSAAARAGRTRRSGAAKSGWPCGWTGRTAR